VFDSNVVYTVRQREGKRREKLRKGGKKKEGRKKVQSEISLS
jgi:hypothetical protein